MKTLQNTLALIIALLPLNSFARTYEITTPNEEIKCTIENLTEPKTLEEFAEFRHLYMPILVKIENNSNSTITLKEEKYLSGLEKSLVHKKKIFATYNKGITKHINNSFKLLIASLISAGLCLGSGYVTYNYFNSDFAPLFFTTTIVLGFSTLICPIAMLDENIAKNSSLEKKKALLKKTAMQKKGSSTKKLCRSQKNRFTIEPGHIFYDILLVNLEEENRLILKNITPKLIYEKQIPQNKQLK